MLTVDDIREIDGLLQRGIPELAIERVKLFVRNRELDEGDIIKILSSLEIFVVREIIRNRWKRELVIGSMAASATAIGFSLIAIFVGICL